MSGSSGARSTSTSTSPATTSGREPPDRVRGRQADDRGDRDQLLQIDVIDLITRMRPGCRRAKNPQRCYPGFGIGQKMKHFYGSADSKRGRPCPFIQVVERLGLPLGRLYGMVAGVVAVEADVRTASSSMPRLATRFT